MGFLNPFLYEFSSSFTTDITTGNNRCLEQSGCSCCSEGYYASSGWDPVSGLGLVDFQLFSAKALLVGSAYPSQNPTLSPTYTPGAPTPIPTSAFQPTLSPTNTSGVPTLIPTSASKPTLSPTYTPGAPTPIPTPLAPTTQYVLFNEYIDETCYGDVEAQGGYLTNTCIAYGNGSSILSCTSQNITIQEFSTPDCTGKVNTSTIDTLNCMQGNVAGFCKEVVDYRDLVLMESGN